MSHSKHRRQFLKLGGAAALGASINRPTRAQTAQPSSPSITSQISQPAPLPKPTGPRVVVVGGGWSGLTMAKYLKRNQRQFDVVLVEKNAGFMSCPLSNLWLADQIDLAFLTHSYYDAAKNHAYLYFQATAIDLDRTARKLYTDQGIIDYEYLVLAPGIDYDYPKIGVEDPQAQHALMHQFPGGFKGFSEMLSLKRKLQDFKGGTLVMTVPSGNYRCMAAPYERACMAAAIFKRNNINASIQLLDMNPDIRIKSEGFLHAWETYYSDIINYESSVEITGVDPFNQRLETDFDEYEFDDAIIYPPIRASRLIERFGLALETSPQKRS